VQVDANHFWSALSSSAAIASHYFMTQHIDIAKLVGAASAPVALIIATSIFLSNLGAKYAMMAGVFRSLSEEYRGMQDQNSIRCRSLHKQLHLYAGRLGLLIRAAFWLAVSILCFVLTVLFTSVSVIAPNLQIWAWVTGFSTFAGLLVLGACVVFEMIENHRAKHALMLETAEFPGVLPFASLERRKQELVQEPSRSGRDRAA
jgi:predicted metal-binding membrane protein